jgi:FkbM family methyltransferase
VLDIGANVGLFTRQIALRLPNVERFLCVEPESNNFHALKYNVRQLGPSASLWNVALSDSDGEARFFRDSQNIGNYSLNDDAMRNRTFDTVTVRCAAADRWMHDHVRLAEEESMIRKSDTQGYDELIISLTPMEVLERIDAAVVELWSIKKPDFDQDAFCRRLDVFGKKSIDTGNLCTTVEILQFLQGDDWTRRSLSLAMREQPMLARRWRRNYPLVFFDAIRVKIHDEGLVSHKGRPSRLASWRTGRRTSSTPSRDRCGLSSREWRSLSFQRRHLGNVGSISNALRP